MFFRSISLSLSLFLNIYSRALFCSLFWEKLSSKLSMDSYFNNFHETKVWGLRNIFLYTLILPPKIYWWRCISSNDAHFVWLIEIPMFPILTKNATSPEEFKNKRGRKKKERPTISLLQIHNLTGKNFKYCNWSSKQHVFTENLR